MTSNILLLEDDFSLSEIIQEFLEEQGFAVTTVFSADKALDLAYEQSFDLFLLDVKVPMGDGFTLLQSLRDAGKDTPAIFLTSLASIDDISRGYEAGCDDYLKKPFELKELLFRIQTLLRRRFSHRSDDLLSIHDSAAFDVASLKLYIQNQPISLPNKEAKLLKLLLQHKGAVLSQQQIFEELWEYGEEPSEMSLRVYVKNLRKHLGKEAIETVKHAGYRLC